MLPLTVIVENLNWTWETSVPFGILQDFSEDGRKVTSTCTGVSSGLFHEQEAYTCRSLSTAAPPEHNHFLSNFQSCRKPLILSWNPSNWLRSIATVGSKPPLRQVHTHIACQYTNTGTRTSHVDPFSNFPNWSPPNSPYLPRRSLPPKARLGRV